MGCVVPSYTPAVLGDETSCSPVQVWVTPGARLHEGAIWTTWPKNWAPISCRSKQPHNQVLYSININKYSLLYPVNTGVSCYVILTKILMLADGNDYDYNMNENLFTVGLASNRLDCWIYII